jgi:uncharacterized protein (TIGR02266 family)
MQPVDDTPTVLEEIRAHEARLGEREEVVWLALQDAAEERAEVLAFTADVLGRIERAPGQRSAQLEAWAQRLAKPPGPVLDSADFERAILDIRRDAILAREALLARIEGELAASHRAVDALLDTAREARDQLLRGPQRGPARPEAGPASGSAPSAKPYVEAARAPASLTSPAPGDAPSPAPQAFVVRESAGRSEAATPVEDVEALPVQPAEPTVGAPVIRQNRRKSLEARVDLHSDSNFFSGFSSNISDGGLFIATEVDLPLGTEVDLRFSLPDGSIVASTGLVCWRRPPNPDLPTGLGLQFGHLTQAARDAVARFMKTRDPIFHED